MSAHIDEPANGSSANGNDFVAKGWLWLNNDQPKIAEVEIWSEGQKIGATQCLALRSDVNAALELPGDAATGFFIPNCRIADGDDREVEIQLSVRFRDGSRMGPLATSHFRSQCTPLSKLHANTTKRSLGLEIGAHALPVPGIYPFYTDSVAVFSARAGHADFLSDGRALPLPSNTLDYLCSSHVLEHLPDPIAAIYEWHRVLKPNGWLYLVVPDKRYTFDATRVVTTPGHLLKDFVDGTSTADVQHIEEFVFQTNWSILRPQSLPEHEAAERKASRDFYLGQLDRGEYVDIHYHTFTPDSLEAALTATGLVGDRSSYFKLQARAERYPVERGDGIGFLLQKKAAKKSAIAETFSLSHPSIPGLSLPLVCPVSLRPLSTTADGRLVASQSNRHYDIGESGPKLLPPPGETPKREWSDPMWRAQRTRLNAAA